MAIVLNAIPRPVVSTQMLAREQSDFYANNREMLFKSVMANSNDQFVMS